MKKFKILWYKFLIWKCKFCIKYFWEKNSNSPYWEENVYKECIEIDRLTAKLKNANK